MTARARSDLVTGLEIMVHSTVNPNNGCREERQLGGSLRQREAQIC